MKMVMKCLLLLGLIVILQSPTISHCQPFTNRQHCPPERCGSFNPIPFPFHLNPSCQSLINSSNAFLLSCSNNSTSSLILTIASQTYQVLHFFPDASGLLIDYLPPNTTSSSCRPFMPNDLTSIFDFHENGNGNHNNYFIISTDNILSLYDCNDSSFCKPQDCEIINGICSSSSQGCCYSLSDPSIWHMGDPFSVFGCREFSSWVNINANAAPKRGVKLEWGVPSNSIRGTCHPNARIVNATLYGGGGGGGGEMKRCQCLEGFVGDGFAQGLGCLKSCLKNGKEAYGRDCYMKQHGRRRGLVFVSGVVALAFSIASLTALFCLLKKRHSNSRLDAHDISFQSACRAHLFTYQELEEATKGFADSQKLADNSKGTIYDGILVVDGTHLAVHKVQCTSKRDLIISRVELLYQISHRHMARILGYSIDSTGLQSQLVVYENPENGTLEQHLCGQRKTAGLDWQKRLNIAFETASVLAFLQCEIIPPIFHHDLQSGCIFLDEDYSVKLAGFDLSGPCDHITTSATNTTDVYNLGVVLLEMITGGNRDLIPTVALQYKIRNGKLEEVVDPLLYYHEQPCLKREQIEAVADLGTRCLLFGGGGGGGGGKLLINDVARELAHIRKQSIITNTIDASLDETFSNSSLLQMISMSPDSIYLP